MIQFRFLDNHSGFWIKGHSRLDTAGKDILCAAVSSAALMAINIVTDVCGCRALIRRDDKQGYLFLSVVSSDAKKAYPIIRGLQLHLQELCRMYPDFIKEVG